MTDDDQQVSISSTFFVRNFWRQNFKPKSQLCSFGLQNFVQKRRASITLMKLTPGQQKTVGKAVNIILKYLFCV